MNVLAKMSSKFVGSHLSSASSTSLPKGVGETWRRVMEQQQMQSWLQHDLTSYSYFSEMAQRSQADYHQGGDTAIKQSERSLNFRDQSHLFFSKLNPSKEEVIANSGRRAQESVFTETNNTKMDCGKKDFGDIGKGFGMPTSTRVIHSVASGERTSNLKSFERQPTSATGQSDRAVSFHHLGDAIDVLHREVSVSLPGLILNVEGSELSSGSHSLPNLESLSVPGLLVALRADLTNRFDVKQVLVSAVNERNMTKSYLGSSENQFSSIDEQETVETDEQVDLENNSVKSNSKFHQELERNLRFHTEFSNHGVKIWLGVNESLKHQLPQLISHIKEWLARQRIPLLQMVCNGESISGLSVFCKDDIQSFTESLDRLGEYDVNLERATMRYKLAIDNVHS